MIEKTRLVLSATVMILLGCLLLFLAQDFQMYGQSKNLNTSKSNSDRGQYLFNINESTDVKFENGYRGGLLYRIRPSMMIRQRSEHIKYKLEVIQNKIFQCEYVIYGRNEKGHQDTLFYSFKIDSLAQAFMVFTDDYPENNSNNELIHKIKKHSHKLQIVDQKEVEIKGRTFQIYKYVSNANVCQNHFWVPDLGVIKVEAMNEFDAFELSFGTGTTKRKYCSMLLDSLKTDIAFAKPCWE